MSEHGLSHIDEDKNPAMVDISDKQQTSRSATAQAILKLPEAVQAALGDDDIASPKGPVFQTAIIAGTQAVKQTAMLIPMCHPLAIDSIKFDISPEGDHVTVSCTVKMTGKTGVEMEALTGASIAALTIYDMCKALSHDIVITETRLIEKTGGKSDIHYGETKYGEKKVTAINMHYFAALRDATQISEETLTTDAVTAGALFVELKSRYDWPYEIEDIKPAINDRYVSMDQALAENDRVVFIPPVAGG